MTQIKIEVPANDHIALSAMAEALQRIAAERKHVDLTPSETNVTQSDAETTTKPFSFMSSIVKGYRAAVDEQSDAEQLNASQHVDVELNRLDEEREAFEASDCVVTVNESDMDAEPVDPSRNLNTEQDDTLDADGIPHDKRIHSKGATRLADNTWRLRKRPTDKTEEEWTTYIDSVKAELKAVQDIPKGVIDGSFEEYLDGCDEEEAKTMSVEPEKLNDIDVAISDEKLEEGSVLDVTKKTLEASLDNQAVADLTPPVIEEPAVQLEGVTPNGDVAIEPPVTTAGAPVAPVTPPTSLTPPVVEADKPSVTTFQELMLYMTSDAKKRGADNDMIKATLLEVDPALTAIPLIATRADLIPKFVEALEAKLK